MPSATRSHFLCCKLCRSLVISSEKMESQLSNLFCCFAGLMAAWIKTWGLTAKAGVGQRGGTSSDLKGYLSLRTNLRCLLPYYLGWSQCPFHGIGHIHCSLRGCVSCWWFLNLDPSPAAVAFSAYSIFCVWNLNFSLQYLPLTSVKRTHPDTEEAGLRLSSSDARQGTGTAKATDAVLTEINALSMWTHKVRPAVGITAQLRRFCLRNNC